MGRLKSEETTDFSRGMFDNVAMTAFPTTAVSLLLNGRIEKDGTVSRRPGSRRKHEETLEASMGWGATWFETADGDEQVLAFVGDKAFMSEGRENTSWTQIASGLRPDFYSFATMRVGADRYLFAANGAEDVHRWDGETWDTLPNAPEGVRFLAVFNGRLWAAGHSGVIVQASRIANPETWASPDGITVQVVTHDGSDTLTGMYQLGPHLLVFDRESTSYIDGFGEQTLVVATGATGFSRSVGCVAFRSIVGVGDNAVCWLSERGVEHYRSGGGISLVSEPTGRFLEEIDRITMKDNPGRPSACYDAATQEYHLALSTDGLRNNRTLVANLLKGGRGQTGALSIDRQASGEEEGDIFFGVDDDGYLTESSGGFEAAADSLGYMTLVSGDAGGDAITTEDDYLTVLTNDALPAVLFMGPSLETAAAVHSLGYDGFVRTHRGVDTDNADDDGDGGAEFGLTVVSRPFLMGSPRIEKRYRVVHIATINEQDAEVTIALRSAGQVAREHQATVRGTAFRQQKRERVMVSARGDHAQVEFRTTEDVRLALIGVSAQVLKEPV